MTSNELFEKWQNHEISDVDMIRAQNLMIKEILDALVVAHEALEYISDFDIPLCTHDTVKNAVEKFRSVKP